MREKLIFGILLVIIVIYTIFVINMNNKSKDIQAFDMDQQMRSIEILIIMANIELENCQKDEELTLDSLNKMMFINQELRYQVNSVVTYKLKQVTDTEGCVMYNFAYDEIDKALVIYYSELLKTDEDIIEINKEMKSTLSTIASFYEMNSQILESRGNEFSDLVVKMKELLEVDL